MNKFVLALIAVLFCSTTAYGKINVFVAGDSRVRFLHASMVANPPTGTVILTSGKESTYGGAGLENWTADSGNCESDTEYFGCIEAVNAVTPIDIVWIPWLGLNDFTCWSTVCTGWGPEVLYADMAAYLAAWRAWFLQIRAALPNAIILVGTDYPTRIDTTGRATCGTAYGGSLTPIYEPNCANTDLCRQESNGMLVGFYELLIAANVDIPYLFFNDTMSEIVDLMTGVDTNDTDTWFDSYIPVVSGTDDCTHLPAESYDIYYLRFIDAWFRNYTDPNVVAN